MLTRPTVCHIVSYCGGVTCVDTATVCHSVSYCGGVTCVSGCYLLNVHTCSTDTVRYLGLW